MTSTRGWLYVLLLVVHAIPIIITPLPTFDGPAHLYNSRLLLDLIKGNQVIDSFFAINNESFTNWTDHVILAFLMIILPAWLAEKAILLLLAVMIPISIVHSVSKEKRNQSLILSTLSFPFVYNFLFGMGFWNFHLGLIIAILLFNYSYKLKFQPQTNSVIIQLLILTLLLYFTHAFVFIIFIVAYSTGFIVLVISKNNKFNKISWLLNQVLRTVAIFLLPILMLFFNFLKGKEILSGVDPPIFMDSIKTFLSGKYLVYLNESTESKIIPWYLIIIGIFVIGAIVQRVSVYKSKYTFAQLHDIYLLISLVIFIIFLFAPERVSGVAGYLKYRLILPFYLFLIIWICNHTLNKWFRIPLQTAFLLLHIWSLNYYAHSINNIYKDDIQEIKEISYMIPENKVILPFIEDPGWLRNHISNYLGTDKPMVILENYEASSGSFPLTWNDQMPQLYLGSKALRKSCRFAVEAENPQGRYIIDYIFIYNYKHEKASKCLEEYRNVIQEEYEEVNTGSERHKLLKYKGI